MSDQGGPSGWQIQQAMAIWHERQKMIIAEDGEMSDEAQKRAIEAQAGGLEAMQVWIVRAIRNAKGMETTVKEERKDLAVREKRFEARADGLRSSLSAIIEISTKPGKDGVRRLVLPIATVSLAPGGQTLEIDDESKIPDDFFEEVTTVVVRKGLKKAELFAAITKDRVDEETGDILPPFEYEGVKRSNGQPQLRITSK